MRVAFFINRAGRTGSEIALCNLITYGVSKGLEACLACAEEGDLLRQLPASVPAFVYSKWRWMQRAYAGMSRRVRGNYNGFTSFVHSRFTPDFWYINTIVQPDYVLEAKRTNVKCVVHSHELEHMLTQVSQQAARVLVDYPQLMLANSEASREVLRFLGRRSALEISYPSINPELIRYDNDTARKLRHDLQIRDDTFVWAMAGTLDPNKNPVRFISIASKLLSKGHNVHFIWLGGIDNSYGLYVKQLAQESGFGDKITFAGPRTDDYYDWLNVANAVVITSLKESFSLVALEAAYLGKPVVSFDSGGVKEIVKDRMGVVIDSWNDRDLVRAMEQVMNGDIPFDPSVAKNRAREFSIELEGQRWLNLLTEYFGR